MLEIPGKRQEAISSMASNRTSVGLQGQMPVFFRSLNVAAEAAAHRDKLWDSFRQFYWLKSSGRLEGLNLLLE
jgi:hypothetical protein